MGRPSGRSLYFYSPHHLVSEKPWHSSITATMSGQKHENSGEHTALSSPTSATSLSDHDDNSETLGGHDPYQSPTSNPLQDILEEGVSSELHQIATALS